MRRLTAYAALLAIAVVAALAIQKAFGPRPLPPLISGSGPVAAAVRPAIGGPFVLVDHDGRTVTDADFHGRLLLIYFGYTFCPDVCPTSLTAIGDALALLGPDAEKVVPILITVDPERDTPAHLKEYVAFFHPRMVALTGSVDQITAVSRAFRVYFAKVRDSTSAPDDYLMDHTAITYLMGRDGKFLAHFSHGTEPEAIAKRIREFF